jgi:hypothetical protein
LNKREKENEEKRDKLGAEKRLKTGRAREGR